MRKAYSMRLEPDIMKWVKDRVKANDRSINAETVYLLRAEMNKEIGGARDVAVGDRTITDIDLCSEVVETHECGSGSVSPLQDQGSDWIGMKIDVSDVIDRLLLVLGAKNDTDYAVLRELPRSTVGNWRRRQSVPYSECEYIFTKYGVSFDWMLTGKSGTTSPSHSSNTAKVCSGKLYTFVEVYQQAQVCPYCVSCIHFTEHDFLSGDVPLKDESGETVENEYGTCMRYPQSVRVRKLGGCGEYVGGAIEKGVARYTRDAGRS